MIEWIDRARWLVSVLFVISLPPALLYWFAVHPFIGFWRRLGTKAAFWIIGVAYLASVVGLYFAKDPLLGRDLGANPVTAAVGIPLLVVAVVVTMKRKKYLTFRILAGVPEIAGESAALLTEGIYGAIRHPRYVEFMLGGTGWALLLNYSGVYLMTVIVIGAIFLIVPLEERELHARFGQAYDEYCERVPRYVPRLGR